MRPMVDFRGFNATELPDAFAAHDIDFAISGRAAWIAVLNRDPRYDVVHEAVVGGNRAVVFKRSATTTPAPGLSD